MKVWIKILIGSSMIALGVFSTLQFTTELLTVLQGSIGFLLLLMGAFIIWLESDVLRGKVSQDQQEESKELQKQFQPRKKQKRNEQKQEVEESEPEKFSCPKCGREFETKRGMKIHDAQKHQQN